MPNITFVEAFSLSGRYFPAGSSVELSKEEVATLPEGVAVESNPQPEEENAQPEGQSTPAEGGSGKQSASEKPKSTAKS